MTFNLAVYDYFFPKFIGWGATAEFFIMVFAMLCFLAQCFLWVKFNRSLRKLENQKEYVLQWNEVFYRKTWRMGWPLLWLSIASGVFSVVCTLFLIITEKPSLYQTPSPELIDHFSTVMFYSLFFCFQALSIGMFTLGIWGIKKRMSDRYRLYLGEREEVEGQHAV